MEAAMLSLMVTTSDRQELSCWSFWRQNTRVHLFAFYPSMVFDLKVHVNYEYWN